jgi:SAM-dependent methyltransferase
LAVWPDDPIRQARASLEPDTMPVDPDQTTGVADGFDVERSFHDEWGESVDPATVAVDATFEGPTSPEPAYMAGLFGDVAGKRLLDVGCGPGEATVYFSRKGALVTALDLSPGMCAATRALAEHHGVSGNVETIVAPAEHSGLPDGSFDLIYGSGVLHHVDIVEAAREVDRLLAEGGRAAFMEPIAYNPAINVYRRMSTDLHTPTEHPLTKQDIRTLKEMFPTLAHREFELMTLAIFVWMYAVERLSPSEVRYWKRIVEEHARYGSAFRVLSALDRAILAVVPPLRWWCWNTVVTWTKTGAE